jgi:gentisate 1,2-dioxygenase
MTTATDVATAERRKFYGETGAHSLATLWQCLHSLVPARPNGPAIPSSPFGDDR